MAGIYGQLIKAQLENLSSDPASTPTGLAWFNTTGSVAKYYDGSAVRTFVSTDGSQVITAKDIDGGTASNTSRLTLAKASTATLSGLTRKQGNLFYDTTLGVPVFDDGSTLTALAVASSALDSPIDMGNYSLTCSVGSSALTIALKTKGGSDPSVGSPASFGFRNATSATGDYSIVSATAATSLVISSGSTLGHSSGVASYFYVYVINNSGTVELAVSTKLFDDGSIQSSTAEGGAGAADSATTLYSTTARSNKAIKLIARLLSSQTTAGTWAAVPTEISLGNKFPTMGRMGRTDGLSIPAGEIGEYVAGTTQTSTSASTSEADMAASLTLNKGWWQFHYSFSYQMVLASASGIVNGYLKITDSGNTEVAHSSSQAVAGGNGTGENDRSGGVLSCTTAPFYVAADSSTYKMRCKRTDDTGSGHSFTIYDDTNKEGRFYAIRVG